MTDFALRNSQPNGATFNSDLFETKGERYPKCDQKVILCP